MLEVLPVEGLDFGAVSPQGPPVRLDLEVGLSGQGSAAIDAIAVDQDADGAYSLVLDPSPCVISAAEPLAVEVRFHPQASGAYNGRLSLSATLEAGTLEVTRRLRGSGCDDPDGDGVCGRSAQPGWVPSRLRRTREDSAAPAG